MTATPLCWVPDAKGVPWDLLNDDQQAEILLECDGERTRSICKLSRWKRVGEIPKSKGVKK
jgi:hypothetical protein